MKSKIQNLTKRKTIAFILTTIMVVLMFIVGIVVNYKKSELTIGKLSTNKMSAISVTGKDLATAENETKYYNTNVNVYPNTGDDNIRYVELQKKSASGKWETYTNEKNNLTYKYMLGDVDNNGKINEYDAALIWGYLAGENDLTALQKIAADINGDGLINNADYQIILYASARYTVNDKTYPYYIGNPRTETNSTSNMDGREGFNIGAEDARTILRLSLGLGSDVNGNDIDINDNLGEDDRKKILVAKMMSDYDFDYKIEYADAELYLKAAVNLSVDDEKYKEMQALAKANGKELDISEFNLESARDVILKSIQASLNLYEQVKDISYYTSNYVKFNTSIMYFPEIEDDGEYKLITYKITTDSVKLNGDRLLFTSSSYNSRSEYYFTIDKKAPDCEVEYTPDSSKITNQNVIATITFDEEVKTSTAKEYSKIQKVEFEEKGKENITYFDKAGNSKIVDLNVTWIDKEKPVLKDVYAERVNEDDYAKIIVTATFDKEISDVGGLRFVMMFGGIMGAGSDEKITKGNQVIYTYYISPTDGGKVEITLSGNVIDLAGNKSDNINQVVKNDFDEFYPTAIEKGKYYYEFIKTRNDVSRIIYTSENNYFKKGDKITVMKTSVSKYRFFNNEPEAEYNYTIGENDQEFADNTHMTYMEFNSNTVKFYDDNIKIGLNYINIKDAKIYFDTKAPTVTVKVRPETANEKNVYTQGTILKISAVASEELYVPEYETMPIPQINVLFSNSGLGKYNYQTDSKKGNAKFIDITNEDGKTVWNYIYEIQSSDDGNISIDYANDDTVIYDMATNETTLVGAPKDITTGDININGIKIDNNNTVSYEIYKNNNKLTKFESATYYKAGDKIKVIAKFNNSLYTSYGSTETLINKDTAPALSIKTSSNDTIKMTATEVNTSGNTVTYEYTVKDLENSKLTDMSLNFKAMYAKVGSEFKTVSAGEKGKVDIRNCNLFIYNSNTEIDTGNISIDTTAPTVKISAKNLDTNKTIENGLTNASRIEYSFKWSEEVSGFTIEDLTIINGTVEELKQDKNDKTLYTLVVKNDVAEGNNGTIKVIVNRDAVKDVVGYSNERFENEIRVDRQAAILIGLEAYAESNIKVNSEVDSVKKYYKAGENVTIIATFTENINLVEDAIPYLALEFSQSGNSKAKASGKVDSNKLIYTYKLADGDNGELSVKGFTGNVVDVAGNNTKVTKRTLDGDTIIADTISPNLKELKITSPTDGTYKSGTKITVEAIFDEEVYILENNEIKNITAKTAPKITAEIGGSKNITLGFAGYGTNDEKVDKTKLIYTYTINNENGKFSIAKVENIQNEQVCDIAGNTTTLTVNQTGKEINVDTIRPEVTSITATVEDPLILGTDPYYKAGNNIKITITFSENVNSAVVFPKIKVGFSENANQKPQRYSECSYEVKSDEYVTTVEYIYTIKDGDNGYLWVEVPENQFADVAGNGNIKKDATLIKNVFADTKRPTLTILEKTEVNQNNQTITVKATFSENVYDLNGNSRIALSTGNAPKLVYSFGDGSNQEVSASSVSGAVITYVIKKNAVYDNGTFMPLFVKGNLYDRAGNPYYIEETDTTAPILQSVVVSSNADIKYKTTEQDNCKEETEIYVTATFDENITKQNMKIKFKIGESSEQEIPGVINSDNSKEVVFKYTVKNGDNGTFTILDVIGNINKDITEEGKDNTYGYVQDKLGNQANIYNFNDITISGKAVADTIRPYVTSIVEKAGDKEVATYTKEEGKDAVITVGRTNVSSIKYIVTMSEDILYNHFDRIAVTNGNIISVEQTAKNEFTIEVQATTEGVQSLILPEGVTEDKAGNFSEFARLDGVTNDFTIPTVRFISEYNGGEYVLPTNIGKIEIRPNIEINEDVSKVEYKWDDEEYAEVNNYSSSSDIAIPSKAFENAGKYTLYIRVTDLAGNQTVANKVYNIYNSRVNFEYSYEYTNTNLEVKVEFETGLTDNRKVLFKANNSKDIIQLNAVGTDGDKIKYSIPENGILYAEATDKVGNKVFNQTTITNIDKERPIIELETNGGNLVIGTDKDKATIKSRVNVEDENLSSVEYAIANIDTSVENVTPENLKENAGLNFTTIENNSEAKIEDAVEGTYYIYVIAKDRAGNTAILKSGKFVIANSNELKDEEGNVTYTPAKENTITFKREKSMVYVDFGFNLSENQRITLTNDEDGITYEEHAEIYKSTVVTATAEDICGNIVKMTYTVENVEGPKFEVQGNLEDWTNGDIELSVICYDNLSALTVNGEDILKNKMKVTIKENGDYTFKATDIYGNSTEKTIKVTNIDKVKPVISKVEVKGNDITITANDELSGMSEYAVTKTTEVPVEWSSSNTISTTKDGTFYVWAKDKAGNVTIGEKNAVVDTTAPTITFEYMSLTVTVGMPIEANIKTNEPAKILYSWDNKTWTESNEFNTSIKVSEKSTKPGKYTLYAKATDTANNTSDVSKVEFSVENIEDIRQPEIIFEDLATVQTNGAKYVKVSSNMTKELLTDKMNKTALCGVTPEYKNLTEDGKLKTGTEILLNGETKYIVAVKGDINGDGKAGDFIEDIIALNRYRINGTGLTTAQIIAGDINNDGSIDFIDDIMQINRYRIGIISIL